MMSKLVLQMLVLAVAVQSADAQSLAVARIFQDGMVVQRDAPVVIWGWAAPNQPVTVALAGHAGRTTADAAGAWTVQLPPAPAGAGGPHTLVIEQGTSTLTIRDVMVGDVWVASGQSNMEWPLRRAHNAEAAARAARDSLLRHFAVPHSWAETPQRDLEGGSWKPATPENAPDFSAVAYFFARDLRAATGVPIGIIHTSWGGSNVQTWMSRGALGLSDSAWQQITERERANVKAVNDALTAKLGVLPTTDAGLVDNNPLWAAPAHDDSNWLDMPVPSLWEQAGFIGLDGTVWYRTTFTLSEAEAQQGARISLGMIDDDDITWVNGIEIGRTNNYAERRIYPVPASALKAGANVLAVRVIDGGGGGGPYGTADQFYVETGSVKRPLPATWKFKVGAASFQADGQRINKIPTVLYNAMLYPLLRFPIKGVIWYQGESNANSHEQATQYRELFAELITSWRREWKRDFPFLWVQLANFGAVDTVPPSRAAWATLRESQTATLRLPATGQAVIIDIGDPRDIHPRQKEAVGRRLALLARRIAYGDETVLTQGPTYRAHTVRGNEILIDYDNIGGGLVSRTGSNVSGFAIAGADGQWHWAAARVDGNRVVVSSASVMQPVAVRYAWSNSPKEVGLFNREGLPAAPFRTDDW